MIKPLNNKIQLDIKELKFGAIESDAIAEQGKIIAIGDTVKFSNGTLDKYKIGATLYFKAWSVDIITDTDGTKYYFIDATSDAICGISD